MISEKSIIEPDAQKPGIPIKKSTMGAILGLVLGGVVVTSLVMQNNAPVNAEQTTAEKPASKSIETGTAAAIDEEIKRTPAVSTQPASAPMPAGAVAQSADCTPSRDLNNPVPPCVRRTTQDAAFGERAIQSISGGQSARAGGSAATARAGSRQSESDVEQEAQARQSKAIGFDQEDSSAAATSARKSDMAIRTAFGGDANQFTLPSATVQPQIDAAISAYKNTNGAAQKAGSTQRGWLNDYASEVGGTKGGTIRPYKTASEYTLHQGKVIPAVLGRMVNSDLAGTVTAYTTMDVYDSLGKRNLLIPKGSSLVGRYNSDVKIGQERVMFAFQRIILPNGDGFDLPSAEGSDLSGAAGATGDVDNHFFKMFASSFMVAWMSDRVQQPAITAAGGTSTSPAGQVLVDVSRTILERNRNLQPTITLQQGQRINVEVVKDMEFSGPYTRSKN